MAKIPQGVVQPDGRVKIAVVLPSSLFYAIRQRCKREDKSFSWMISDLAECGLRDMEESESYEIAR